MGLQRHVSGSLKQNNKKHKAERKRSTSLISKSKSKSANKHLSKKARKLIAKQQRVCKSKMISVAQKQMEKPITCLLLPLCSSTDMSLARAMFATGDPKAFKHRLPHIDLLKNSYEADYVYAPNIKKSFCFIGAKYGDLFGCLELARLADWIIFLLPGDVSKINFNSYSELMSALYAQGLPPSIFVVMSNISNRKELLSMLQSKFSVSDGKVRSLNSSSDAQCLLRFLSQSQKKPILSSADSYLATKNALKVGTAATRLRSGMLAEAIDTMPNEDNEDEVYLRLEGLLRGWDLPLFDIATSFTNQQRTGCPYMHLTGWGDFPLRTATWVKYKPDRQSHQPASRLSWKATSAPDAYLADDLAAAWDNLHLSDDDAELDESDEDKDGMSVDDEEAEEETDDRYVPSDSDDESVYFDAIDSKATSCKAVSFETNPAISATYKSESLAEKIKAAKMERQFPDEVETPFDIPARERFGKYKGLPSFNKCTWLTEANAFLPNEYAKIFRFANYAHNRRTLIKHTLRLLRQLAEETGDEPTSIPSGSIASLTLGPMPKALGTTIMELHTDRSHPRPLTVWSLLPYERCMSVLHLTMHKRHPNRQEIGSTIDEEDAKNDNVDPDPIAAKESMLFQVGIRRFIASPIYSQPNKAANTNAKMERFFTLSSSSIIATMYAPVIYAPQTALQFRIRPIEGAKVMINGLVATGSVLSIDPARAIIKRILLSGHPYKINKRSAVVRYMFHTPEDIEYFKPVQLHTKAGAVGHIKQSVGTHGLMKCLFDRQLIASDVILMPLYKRVFPKLTFDPQVMRKIAEFHLDDEPKIDQTPQPLTGILKSKGHRQDLFKPIMLTPDEESLFV